MRNRSISSLTFAATAAGALLLFPAVSHGVRTETVVQETYQHFLDGELKNVSLHRDGRLTLAPAATEIAKLADAVIWSVAAGQGGSVYIGAGNEGKVYRLSETGELAEVFTAEEVFVRALAVDEDGRLYAGSSPDGKVYRIDAEGEAEVFFNPRETYIWSLLFGPEGDLFVGTGDQGRIYRVPAGAEPGSAGEVYFDSDETHISTLVWDREDRLLAGTSPNGYVYRIEEKEKAFLLFNSPDEEIREIVAGGEGELFVGTFSTGAGKSGGSAGGTSAVSQAVASLTVEEVDEEGEGSAASSSGTSGSGGSKRPSAIYRVGADGFYEPFWALADVSIHSLLKLENGPLLIGTGSEGRIFSLTGFQAWQLRQKLPSGSDVTALLPVSGSSDVLAFTSNPARVFRLDYALSAEGEFLSDVFDAGQVTRWGRLYVETTEKGGARPQVFARSGNTEKADSTWTGWIAIDADGQGEAELQPARYFQYRLAFAEGVDVRRVRFFFRHANAAPVIRAMRVVTANLGLEKFELPPQTPAVDLDQLFRTPSSRSRSSSDPRQQIRAYEQPGTVTVAWQVSDPNEDPLIFTVRLRQAGSESWSILGDEVTDTFFSFNGNGFPEGHYQAEVIASDRLSNPPGEAREARRVSELFVIDNTAPEIVVEPVAVNGSSATIRFEASDAISLIAAADFIKDGEDPVALFPGDRLFDAATERFEIQLDQLEPGHHTVLIRVADELGNLRVHQLGIDVTEQ